MKSGEKAAVTTAWLKWRRGAAALRSRTEGHVSGRGEAAQQETWAVRRRAFLLHEQLAASS